MPYPNYPYPYTYHKPSKQENIALGIGAVLSGLLNAAGGESTGDAIVRGIGGAAGGYSQGWNQYQNQMGDAFQRYMQEQNYNRMLTNDISDNAYNQAIMERMAQPKQVNAEPKMSLQDQQNRSIQNRILKTDLAIKQEKLNKARTPTPLEEPEEKGRKWNPGDIEYHVNKSMGNQYQEAIKDAEAGRSELGLYGSLNEIMESTTTGQFEPFKTKLAAIAQGFGLPVDESYNANQTIEAISNKLAVMARNVGQGMTLAGSMSDADREFLVNSVPNLKKMPGANQKLIDINIKLAKRKIDIQKLMENYYSQNKTLVGFNQYRDEWVKSNPLFAGEGNYLNLPTQSQVNTAEDFLKLLGE